MDNQDNGSSSPISREVLDVDGNSARDESHSRRKLEFEDEGEQDVDGTGNINLIHSKMSDEAIPKIDMKFATEDATFKFYLAYASKVGFGVRRSKEHKNASGRLVTRMFCCCCEGKRGKRKPDSSVKLHRPVTRSCCLARMKIKYCHQTEQFYVAEFAPMHNHMVTTPSKTHLHRSHRKLGVAQAAEADMAGSVIPSNR